MPPKKATASGKAKKPAAKKPVAKKAAPKKAAPKKATASGKVKKAAPKKAAPKKVAAKKKVTAKSTPTKSVSTKSSTAAKTQYTEWFWQGDGGNFMPYDAKINQTLEDKFEEVGGSGCVQLSFNGWNYDIDFDKMIQKNKTTGRERQLQRQNVKAATASIQKEKQSASGVKRQRAVVKGRGVVDALSGKVDTCHVYEAANGTIYQCTLNQTNIGTNNNKFYVLQLLEEDQGSQYYLFTRWGRVGVDGQMLTEQFANPTAGVAAFKKKFHDKTRNDWDQRGSFVKVPGKYQFMQIDYTGDEDEPDTSAPAAKKPRADVAPSTLPKAVQDLMARIGSREAMTSALKELDIDTKKMPLGKISKEQIKQAYDCLCAVEKELKKAKPNTEASTALFYTLIPHDFGFRRPPLINSELMVREKMDMLESLENMEVASKLLDQGNTGAAAQRKNHLDTTYDSLHCRIEPLPRSSAEYKRVVEYAKNTHGKTHTNFKLEVEEVFAVSRDGEDARYQKRCGSLGNKRMLWHGSRTTNFMGILSQGLRIAPPEAPVTGYMFGKGIYLADVCSKSANYCNTSRTNSVGLMLLCEAALGKPKTLTGAMYMEKPQKGTDSTEGVGRMHPGGGEVVDDVLWPNGKMVTDKVPTSLLYPEYIVYDVDQCAIRYLVQMRFKY